jgi:hypothetical protein
VIPARDEECSITGCLEALVGALEASCDSLIDSWIVLVADSCADATASLGRKLLAHRGTVIECSVASPGEARRIGAAEVLTHFAHLPARKVWIANTDADSRVTQGWIGRQLELAKCGYCGVAGIVRVDTIEGLDQTTLKSLLADYTIHSDGSHPHVHGANMGVRADAYIDAGCWSNLAVAEDHCLWSRLKARGWPTASCARTVVHTSGRLFGRAQGGFADSLRTKLRLRRAGAIACTR